MSRAALLACFVLSLGCQSTADHGAERAGDNCDTCHMSDYRAVSHPVHVDKKPTKCAVCHTQNGWSPSVLDHPWWTLTGAHENASCFGCHEGNPPSYKGTKKACIHCHRADFEKSKFPGHADFATTCGDCHSTTNWKKAKKPKK